MVGKPRVTGPRSSDPGPECAPRYRALDTAVRRDLAKASALPPLFQLREILCASRFLRLNQTPFRNYSVRTNNWIVKIDPGVLLCVVKDLVDLVRFEVTCDLVLLPGARRNSAGLERARDRFSTVVLWAEPALPRCCATQTPSLAELLVALDTVKPLEIRYYSLERYTTGRCA